MPQTALSILLGALLAFYGNQLQDPLWTYCVPLLLLLARCNPGYRFVTLLAAGFLWSNAMLQLQLSHRLADEFDNRDLSLRGVIADIPGRHPDRVTLLLEDLEIAGHRAAPRRARLNWYQTRQVPRAGERWQFRVRLRQARGLLNPAGFDYERWLFVEGIDAGGYILPSRDNRRLEAAPFLDLDHWRERLAGRIERDCSQCRHSGLIKALALGLRGAMDVRTRRLLQSSGTAHLLAISGLHIGMVALLCYGLGRCAWRLGGYRLGCNRREMAASCALLSALAYSGLAGFSLPTLRALLMLALVLAGLQLNRRVDLLQSAALALVIILVVDPLAVGSNSFWLSFGALLVIAFAAFRQPGEQGRWRQLFLLQCYFALLFAPVGALIFGQLNPASLPANLVAIPALSLLVLPAVLCASLLSMLDLGGASLLFLLADHVLAWLLAFLEWLLAAGLQPYHPLAMPGALWLMALVAMALLLMPRWSAMPLLAVVMLVAPWNWRPDGLEPGDYELTVLDVGMGSSVLLRTRHYSLVYDFGPGRRDGYNAAERSLLPLLRKHGIEHPDLLVVSHVDQDHSGGFHAFRDDYEPSRLLSGTPQLLRQRMRLPRRVRSCHGHAGWNWDGVHFRFLPLDTSRGNNSNNRSCVLQVQGHHRALLPGDIETAQEEYLVDAHGDALASDILLAPHHGSKTSSSEAFVATVSPALVVFTLSRNNRWGFPDGAVAARYRDIAGQLLRSDTDGAITITSRRGGLSVKSMRQPPRRVWRRW